MVECRAHTWLCGWLQATMSMTIALAKKSTSPTTKTPPGLAVPMSQTGVTTVSFNTGSDHMHSTQQWPHVGGGGGGV